MKKKIYFLLSLLLFTTGCSCEYNLKIENNTFKENINLISTDENDLNAFNRNWQIPIDKDEYNIGTDPDSENTISGKLYNQKLSGNNLQFNYDFSLSEFNKSSAISNCYNTFNVNNYGNRIIISTSQNAICFDKYPTLDTININITVDRTVKSSNADSINGKTYTWILTRSNHNKGINLVLEKDQTNNDNLPSGSNNNINRRKKDYTMYILSGILLIVFLIGYIIYKKITSKDDSID